MKEVCATPQPTFRQTSNLGIAGIDEGKSFPWLSGIIDLAERAKLHLEHQWLESKILSPKELGIFGLLP